ncbi:MAG TPA: site-specific integrase, partial [Chloroflexota bacterium]|nr:site-specific integrase [Chloroflexota bacterium]
FPGPLGEPIGEHPIRRVFRQTCQRASLPRIRLHDLRHTSATLLLTAGVHSKVVSERLGHSTISITLNLYSHVSKPLQQDAADKLGEMLRRPAEDTTKEGE